MKKIRGFLFWLVIYSALLLAAASLCRPQETPAPVAPAPPKPPVIEYGPQIVYIFDRSNELGHKFVAPYATVIFHLLPDQGPTVRAPLKRGDFLLCRYYTLKDVHDTPHIALKCGQDTYVLQGIELRPPKDAGKASDEVLIPLELRPSKE